MQVEECVLSVWSGWYEEGGARDGEHGVTRTLRGRLSLAGTGTDRLGREC